MTFKWFASRTVRLAGDMSKHVRKILDAQRDLLSPQAANAVEGALGDTKKAINDGVDEAALKKQIDNLETVANKWLKPYPHAGMRENVEVLLVALAVAMAIRTFFLQPFKIPTGSMQPTLMGETSENPKARGDVKVIPGTLARIFDAAVFGTFYHYQVAEEDGELVDISQPGHFLKFINTTSITMRYPSGDKTYDFYCVPEHFAYAAGIDQGQTFHKGEPIVQFKDVAGDHLFVDRLSYNFRHPTRGEIIVFETRDIGNEYGHLPPDQFYIKRLVALGGESVRIGNDRHLVIDGKRLDSSTPHFEKVYTFDPNEPARDHRFQDSPYSGHLNQTVANQYGLTFSLAPLFRDESEIQHIRPEHYMVMGDNTANSSDSRTWGDFSRTNVIGKYFFVYWPFSKRFGAGVR